MKQRLQVVGVFVGVLLMFGVAAYSAADVGGSSPSVGSQSTVGACSTLGRQSDLGELSAPGCDTMGGTAYAFSAVVALLGKPTISEGPFPNTGQVSSQQSEIDVPPCTSSVPAPINASLLCAGVTATNNTSTADSSLATMVTSIPGLPVITLKLAHSTSTTSCSGSTGTSSIAYLAVGSNVIISKQTTEAPNTGISTDGVTILFNQQTPITGYTHGLTVTAIRITVNISTLVHVDIVAGSATSTLEGC